MSKHAYAIYRVTATRLRRPDDRLNLGNIAESGMDLLTMFHGFLRDVHEKPLVNPDHKVILKVPNVTPAGRTVKFTTETGHFGTAGSIVSTESGETTHSYGEKDATVAATRNYFVSPPTGEVALLFSERYGGRGAASRVLTEFKKAFRAYFDYEKIILNYEGLIDQAGWHKYLENADMTKIVVKRYGLSSDRADGTVARFAGRIEHVAKPRFGEKRFPRVLRDRLFNGELSAQDIFGLSIPDEDEVDIEVQLDDNRQQKSLVLRRQESPVLTYQLADDEDDQRPDDTATWDQMSSKVSDLRPTLGMSLGAEWETRPWTTEQLRVSTAAVRDG